MQLPNPILPHHLLQWFPIVPMIHLSRLCLIVTLHKRLCVIVSFEYVLEA